MREVKSPSKNFNNNFEIINVKDENIFILVTKPHFAILFSILFTFNFAILAKYIFNDYFY